MNFEFSSIPDVVIVEPGRFADDRGYFMETYRRHEFYEATGMDPEFLQDNFSYSEKKNTIRGLHFQAPPHSQGKLVRCIRGAVLDVAVDIRVGSPTYKQCVTIELSAENSRQLWIPTGFLHGFRTLLPQTEIVYKCTDYYVRESEGSVLWNDKELAIDWGIHLEEPILSEKDKNAKRFSEARHPFVYNGSQD